jgi:ribosomal protein L20A (L18A)
MAGLSSIASRQKVRRSRLRLQHLRQVGDHQEVADGRQYLHEQLSAEQVYQVRDAASLIRSPRAIA